MQDTVAKKSKKTIPARLVLLIAGIEGFATLAVEILVLRLAIPVVGSSIVLTSVFLGIILLALSAGYYVGGRFAERLAEKNIWRLLALLLGGSAVRYWVITFALEQQVLGYLLQATGSYVGTLFAAAIFLCLLPVFFASQAVPLLTQLLPISSKGKSAGTLLFVSTIGSFLGSVVTSIVLLPTVGVYAAGCIVVGVLLACVAMIMWRERIRMMCIAVLVALCVLIWQSLYRAPILAGTRFHTETVYQEIHIIDYMIDGEPVRVFHTNRAFASGIGSVTRESPFAYIRGMVNAAERSKPAHILVIGAAGFTLPYELSKKEYVQQIDVVDIDNKVKDIAEKEFLQEKLSDKVNFYPLSARYALHVLQQQKKRYDMVFLDAYNGKSIPEELTTWEFFADVKKVVEPQGRVVANMILDRELASDYAQTLFATRKAARGQTRVASAKEDSGGHLMNALVSNVQISADYMQREGVGRIATDDKRTTDLDGVAMYRPK